MSIEACAAMVREVDPDRFSSAMCVKNLPQRADLMSLYAFNIEVARAPWVTKEPMIAEMRLQWWKDAIDEIYTEKTVRKHEVVTPLADLIDRNPERFPRALFDDLIEARRFDISPDGHEDMDGFNSYLSNTSAGLVELAGRALGATDLEPIRQAGWAIGLSNLFVALPALYGGGKDPIPLGSLDRNAAIEGRLSADNASIIKDLAQEGLSLLSNVNHSEIDSAVWPALLAGWRAKGILQRVYEDPEAILTMDFSVTQFERASTLFWRNLRPSGLFR